jgi:hypothetical protein
MPQEALPSFHYLYVTQKPWFDAERDDVEDSILIHNHNRDAWSPPSWPPHFQHINLLLATPICGKLARMFTVLGVRCTAGKEISANSDIAVILSLDSRFLAVSGAISSGSFSSPHPQLYRPAVVLPPSLRSSFSLPC